MPNFIRVSETQIINLNHVTDFEFRPHEPKTKQSTETKARLIIYLTSTELETTGYEGNVDGVAATSRLIKLHGEEAERVWKYVSDICVGLGQAR